MSWRDARKGPQRKKNQGCVYCGLMTDLTYSWVLGGGRVAVCPAHKAKPPEVK